MRAELIVSIGNEAYIFKEVNDIRKNQSYEDIVSTLSFSLPDTKQVRMIRPMDDILLNIITDSEKTYTIFRGRIKSFTRTFSSTERKWNFEAYDKLGTLNYIRPEFRYTVTTIPEFFNNLQNQMNDIVPGYFNFDYSDTDDNMIPRNLEDSSSYIEYIRSIKENSILNIFYDNLMDKVIVTTPFKHLRDKVSVPTWMFALSENILSDIDYGEISSFYNKVTMIGAGKETGTAYDFMSISQSGERNYIEYDFSTSNREDLKAKAREKLLDFAKSTIVSFEVPLTQDTLLMNVGDYCKILDDDTIKNTDLLLISDLDLTINSDTASMRLTAYTSYLLLYPERMTTEARGITDEDMPQMYPEESEDLGITRIQTIKNPNWNILSPFISFFTGKEIKNKVTIVQEHLEFSIGRSSNRTVMINDGRVRKSYPCMITKIEGEDWYYYVDDGGLYKKLSKVADDPLAGAVQI